MESSKYSLSTITIVVFLCVQLSTTAAHCAVSKQTIAAGMIFPNLSISSTTNTNFINYLGLTKSTTDFTTSQIKCTALLVEFFNTHCPHCHEQAPIYNQLYDRILECGEDCAQMKMIAIAVGNSASEVESFCQLHGIKYPVFPDSNFNAWRAIGGKSSPLTVIVHQDGVHKKSIVFSTHLGLNRSYRHVYGELNDVLEISDDELQAMIESAEKALPPPVQPGSPQALEDEVSAGLRQLGRVTGLKKIELAGYEHLYSALVHKDRHAKRLFAQIIERHTACDVCHDVRLICIFDTTGTIVEIVPLLLSKDLNLPWDQTDIDKLKLRLIGRKLYEPQQFDPQVDAISSATISSAMIFDSIAESKELYEALDLASQESNH